MTFDWTSLGKLLKISIEKFQTVENFILEYPKLMLVLYSLLILYFNLSDIWNTYIISIMQLQLGSYFNHLHLYKIIISIMVTLCLSTFLNFLFFIRSSPSFKLKFLNKMDKKAGILLRIYRDDSKKLEEELDKWAQALADFIPFSARYPDFYLNHNIHISKPEGNYMDEFKRRMNDLREERMRLGKILEP